MRHLVTIAVVLITATGLLADQPKLYKPPPGFEWQECEGARLWILKPKEWFFKYGSKKDTETFALSKENIDKEGAFRTGLTVNYVTDLSQRAKVTATQYAEQFAKIAIREHERIGPAIVKTIDVPDYGPVRFFIFRIRIDEPPEPLVMHNVIVADDKTDCLHIMFFEAPEDEWESAWKVGDLMLKKFSLRFTRTTSDTEPE